MAVARWLASVVFGMACLHASRAICALGPRPPRFARVCLPTLVLYGLWVKSQSQSQSVILLKKRFNIHVKQHFRICICLWNGHPTHVPAISLCCTVTCTSCPRQHRKQHAIA
ncbi:hypothetical protein BCR44DRAFT_1425544 [Catenaria anguillulae PL171]|uniref:Secreted protein n=1 Tax=Catenaria anguillulae PL171 TaxID=765915 RepID=A0A1Y2HYT8_9FUNG|nr:hypothetical protein BCR44DRAFT_1425544 [Catenaria anguillulae PL171]